MKGQEENELEILQQRILFCTFVAEHERRDHA
jgi:hypothetical protein